VSASPPGAVENLLARLQGFLEANLEGARDIRRDIRIDNLASITAGNARQAWEFDVRWHDGGEQRKALAKLEWMVVRDYFLTETATFWDKNAPEIKSGELRTEDIKTEIFFLPAAHVAEMEGSFTNTHRLLQWHEKAVDPPGEDSVGKLAG